MDFKLIYLPLAQMDIVEIDEYLSQFYPGTARRFFDQLAKTLAQLKDLPDMGTPHRDYRKLIVQQYLVFYKTDYNHQTIKIFRILRGAVDIDKCLGAE